MGHDHGHGTASPGAQADRRWLLGALALIVAFMIGEVTAGLLAHSLALVSDAGHLLTDAVALVVAIAASRIAERPARGAYTYGFARVDALSGQANGITLLLLAIWFTVESIRHLVDPAPTAGGVMTVVEIIGVVVNVAATSLASRANQRSLNIKGAVAHLINDLWAFVATAVAGIIILFSGWTRADAIATLIVALLMAHAGLGLVRASGRVFLEAAPSDVDPGALGAELAAIPGVAQIHDLHIWQIGSGETALSAHVLVEPSHDCHGVGERLRVDLAEHHGIGHVTLQVDHQQAVGSDAHCADSHGPVHSVVHQD